MFIKRIGVKHKIIRYTLPMLGMMFICVFFATSYVSHATTGINKQLNFQGRLLNKQGAVAPDGYYNIQFKIYQDGDGQSANDATGTPAGTLLWTEDYVDNNNNEGVLVKNGYMSVQLGSKTPFGTSVDWNQDTLWLSMNIAGSDNTCTTFGSGACTADGEMLPMKRLSSTPYSLNSGMLNGLTSAQFLQIAQGVQTDTSTNTNSIYLNKTGSGNIISLQSSGADAFTINNTGDILFGNNANHTISVTTASASAAGKSLSMSAGSAGTGATALEGGNLVLQGGNGGGTNGAGGDVSIDAGIKNGSGSDGTISIGTSHASTIQIGSTTVGSGNTQTINIGTTTTGTTNVVVGSASGATAGTTTMQSKGNMSLSSGGTLGETSTGDMTMTSTNGNMSLTTDAGTLSLSGSGNTSVTSTGGTLQMTGHGDTTVSSTNGNTSVSSTTGTVGLSSSSTTSISTNGATRATFDTSYAVYFGAGVTGAVNPFTLSSTGGTAGVAGSSMTIQGGTGGSNANGGALTVQGGTGGTTSGAGGALSIQGGNATAGNSNGGDLSLNAGAKSGNGTNGAINIGTTTATTISMGNSATSTISIGNTAIPTAGQTINIGNTALAANIQTINVGYSSTNGGTTNVNIGSGSNATGGTTTVQSRDNMTLNSGGTLGVTSAGNITITTNGTVRSTFDSAANTVYFGNGVTAAAPNNFVISGTSSSTTAVSGGAITIQGGNASVGSANGGNITLSGGAGIGTGVSGLVVLTTPTFSTTANDANCYTGGALVADNCTIASSSLNGTSAVIVGFNTLGKTASLPDPTITTAGKLIYVTAANGSSDFTLSVNGGGAGNTIAMRQNTTATMIWSGSDWTAAGASSSTTLQSAYDNTLQSAGGAELVVSHTATTNGLTIRDSSSAPVNGTLLSIQTSSAAGLLSVNSNVSEYASDAGAEVAGSSASTFPSNTWSAVTGSTVTRYTTVGEYIATGQGSVSVATSTSAGSGAKNNLASSLISGTSYNVSFTTRLLSGTFTDMEVYYSNDGSTASTLCTNTKAAVTSVWTKVNCTFAAPSSGITSGNAIIIRQTGSGTSRTFYIDNLSVTIAADYNYATDGSVNDGTNFATNWSFVNATSGVGSTSRNTSDGYDASDSAGVTITTGAANAGIRNKLSINPLTNSLYRISAYVKLSSGTFTDLKIRYSPIGSTGSSGTYVDCVDYNTQTITTTSWTKISCYIQTGSTTVTTPYIYFVESTSATRTYYIDTFSMTLADESVPNVQIGGGVNGGPVTLFTLDRGASAPIASDNNSLLGSMYYDTTLGKLQCYEADGWGACGSSPDNVVTLSPEFTNAVMHGTGVGTMTSDLCSDTLDINDGSSIAGGGTQPTICGTNETYNFYKWTSPQASAQTYSIYVTYQLPSTFKEFTSGQTSLMGRTDSTNSTVQYQIYKNDSVSGLATCGSAVTVSTGIKTSWQTVSASGTADPSTCGFAAGNSIVFKISMTASQNANAYIGNLNFIFSNR